MSDEIRIKFRQLMQKAGLSTYDELSAKSDISYPTINRILSGNQEPNTSTLILLAEALNVSPGHLLDLICGISPSGSEKGVQGPEIYFQELIERHCSVFVGREREISAVQDCMSQSESGYIFIEGLSGFGKTALLANLTSVFPNAAYHFFNQALEGTSQIFDPNTEEIFLRNLCQQLALKSTSKVRLSPRELRRIYLSFLTQPDEGQAQTIVIIDAIDEVNLNQNFLLGLFPKNLAQNTYVIFSARKIGDRSYLPYVGLTEHDINKTICLDGFDRQGIVALLEKVGGKDSDLVGNEDVVDALYEVTEGDPFYLRFLIEDIQDGHIQQENVQEIPKGLYEYLDFQFHLLSQRAESKQQRDILGYILKSAGPLSREDIIDLVEDLDGFNFDSMMDGIRRFLLEYDQKYTIIHDRFKQYFIDRARI